MKRALDIAVSFVGLTVLLLPMLAIGLLIRLESPGPAIHWSRRIGRGNRIFAMPKFRTMRTEAPDVATHLLPHPAQWITPLGRLLRGTSLDELPQLWSVLTGQMSLVGPRPALFNQDDLRALRTEAGVHVLRPGVTGWAQVNGRDELSVREKVRFDREYLHRRSLGFDLRILVLTAARVLRRDSVSH